MPTNQGATLLRVMWATAHGLGALSKRMEHDLGVTAPQRLALCAVAEQPGITAGGVAAAVGLHPSTVTGILRRLEDRGHLLRSTDPGDRRVARFRLTPSGAALVRIDQGTVEAVVHEVLAADPDPGTEAAIALLSRLAGALSTAAGVAAAEAWEPPS